MLSGTIVEGANAIPGNIFSGSLNSNLFDGIAKGVNMSSNFKVIKYEKISPGHLL